MIGSYLVVLVLTREFEPLISGLLIDSKLKVYSNCKIIIIIIIQESLVLDVLDKSDSLITNTCFS